MISCIMSSYFVNINDKDLPNNLINIDCSHSHVCIIHLLALYITSKTIIRSNVHFMCVLTNS